MSNDQNPFSPKPPKNYDIVIWIVAAICVAIAVIMLVWPSAAHAAGKPWEKYQASHTELVRQVCNARAKELHSDDLAAQVGYLVKCRRRLDPNWEFPAEALKQAERWLEQVD